jgi:hypothetical protein
LTDHDEIIYSPVLFTVRPDLGQSTDDMRRLSLPRYDLPR